MWRAANAGDVQAPFGRRLARAAAWSTAAQWLRLSASLLILAVTARLLGPEAFGLVAIAGLVTALGYVFVDSTLLESLVQRDRLEPGHADAMFWCIAAMGLLTMLGSMAAAEPVARFFERPDVAVLVMVSSPCLLLSALAAVPVALLQRQLRFDLLAVGALSGVLLGGSLGLTLALLGFGVWSLIAQQLATAAVELLVLFPLSRWRPGFAGRLRHLRDLGRFNLAILTIRLLEYVNAQLPRSLLAYLLGAVSVGEFAFARRFIDLLSNLLIHPVARVALPAFSRARHDRGQTRRYLTFGLWMTSLLTYPCFVGLAIVAPALVSLLFGEQWAATGVLIQILALTGVRKGPASLNNALLRGLGQPRLQVLMLLLSLFIGASGMLLLADWGLIGIGFAVLLRDLLLWPVSLLLVARLSQVPVSEQLRSSLNPAIASVLMAGILLLWVGATEGEGPLDLIAAVGLGAVVYVSVTLLLDRRRLREAAALVRGLGLPGLAAGGAVRSRP